MQVLDQQENRAIAFGRLVVSLPGGYHRAVLARQTLEALAPKAGEWFVDGTAGGGGHSQLLLEAGVNLIALDQDMDALAYAGDRLEPYGEKARLLHANFRSISDVLDQVGVAKINGALLDLGVSSWQIDEAARGFSFQKDGPLDMRMDQSQGRTAADLVNHEAEETLSRLFRDLGEEPAARRVAAKIVEARKVHPFETTLELAALVEGVIPRFGKRHPATLVFQALRMAVNDELGALEEALKAFTGRLAPGGRLAVITFHSLEDRIVKQFFKERTQRTIDRPEWPEARQNPMFCFEKITTKAVVADREEVAANPRARSAKLRAVRKTEESDYVQKS